MFLAELVDPKAETEHTVLALLNLVKKRYENVQAAPKVNMLSFLTLAKNVGTNLDYDSFVDIYNSSAAIKNIVSDFNKKVIVLSTGSDTNKPDTAKNRADDQDVVSKMAKQAVDI